MAEYQNTGLTASGTTVIGSALVKVAATPNALSSGTNIGLCRNIVLTENITPYTTQADNGPDPLEGVSEHTATITFDLLEFHPPTFDEIRGGDLDTEVTSTAGSYITGTVNTISTGGLTALTDKSYLFQNVKTVSGATVETVIVVYKAHLNAGMAFNFQSDNSDDPLLAVPCTLEAVCDTTRTKGDQLFLIETANNQ